MTLPRRPLSKVLGHSGQVSLLFPGELWDTRLSPFASISDLDGVLLKSQDVRVYLAQDEHEGSCKPQKMFEQPMGHRDFFH